MVVAKAREAYDSSPIGVLLVESVEQNGVLTDLKICYANEQGAKYWGAAPEQMIGMHFLAADENADERWLDIHREIQGGGKKKSISYLSPVLNKSVQVDCFLYSPGVTGCFIRDIDFEVGKSFLRGEGDDTRPLTELEEGFLELARQFSTYEPEEVIENEELDGVRL